MHFYITINKTFRESPLILSLVSYLMIKDEIDEVVKTMEVC